MITYDIDTHMITATMEGNAAAQDFLSHLPLKATLPFIPRGVTLQFSAFLAPTHLSSEKFVAVVLMTNSFVTVCEQQ
ncbi:Flavodoxin domain protein [Bacteroides fragilis]